jgi:large subunit ribosomal protein L24
MELKKGDQVKIIAGKDRGKTGAVLHIVSSSGRLSVEGINLYKKRSKPKRAGEKGEVVSVPRSMNASNVMLICKNCKQTTRIGFRVDGKEKVRYCKKCGNSN